MTLHIRVYDAETEELVGEGEAETVAALLNLAPFKDRRLLLRDARGHLIGFAVPQKPASPSVRWDHAEHQARVRHGYRSVRPPNDDLSSA